MVPAGHLVSSVAMGTDGFTMDWARALMHEWTESESLRHHMECVSACMGHYARALEPDQEERWRIAGLLHDFDYEKHPSTDEHPFVGVEHLASLGVDEETRNAILAHAEYSGTPRDTPMAKALFAVDELSGFIVACAKVRPDGIASLQPKSVKKKLKDKSFAAAVSREDIEVGAQEIGALMEIERDEHIANCIGAIGAM